MKLFSKILAAAAALAFSLAACAGEVPFDRAQFDKALAEGKPVVVDFFATWCPTCRTQKPIISMLLKEPKLKDVIFFVANYDTEKELRKEYRVSRQATLVVFKGGKEVARSTGETRQDELEDLLDKAL